MRSVPRERAERRGFAAATLRNRWAHHGTDRRATRMHLQDSVAAAPPIWHPSAAARTDPTGCAGHAAVTGSAEVAYAVGLMATDGNLARDRRHMSFGSRDPDLVETLRRCVRLIPRARAIRTRAGGTCTGFSGPIEFSMTGSSPLASCPPSGGGPCRSNTEPSYPWCPRACRSWSGFRRRSIGSSGLPELSIEEPSQAIDRSGDDGSAGYTMSRRHVLGRGRPCRGGEMADSRRSKRRARKGVRVQIPPPVPPSLTRPAPGR